MIFFLLLSILTKADVPRVTAEELRAMLERGEAVAVDVRGSVPYELGHLPGAFWMPLGVLNQRAGELPEGKTIVAYCTCKAEETSLEAALVLLKLGQPKVAVLHGGYPAWLAAEFPVSSTRGERRIPAAVSCSGELKSIEGEVSEYRRGQDSTVLRVGTETVTLAHAGSEDPSRFFLIHGSPLAANDWNRIEAKKGQALPGMKAVAWICSGGQTFVDWLPAR